MRCVTENAQPNSLNDFFPQKLKTSATNTETFHQDISSMDKRYLSKGNAGNLKKNFHIHKTCNEEEKSSECVIM
jgi:hypothetical protein